MVAEQWADAGNLTDDRKCPVPFLRLPRLRSIIIMIIIITTTMLSFALSLLFLSGQELISPRELIGLGMNACLSRLLKDARGKGRIYHALPPFYYFQRKHRIRFPYGEFSITMSFSLFSGGFFCGIWFFSIIGKRGGEYSPLMIPFLRECNESITDLKIDAISLSIKKRGLWKPSRGGNKARTLRPLHKDRATFSLKRRIYSRAERERKK